MNNPFEDHTGSYLVLRNAEEQHSLWAADIEVPAGWQQVSHGSRQDCLGYIDRHWTDMRPLSLRART
ncbi:MbtH family protein [Kribbella sp. NPDC051718]|uniref:MbtH family protein n=1 Tax=Kribbella sp. NPDC051718 TaxID=3155168 RepID=UPI00343AB8E8